MKHRPSRDTVRPSASRDIPCILRNPKVNVLFCAAQRHFVVQLSERPRIFNAEDGTTKLSQWVMPNLASITLDLAPHPRRSANLREAKTRRVEVSFACTQESVTYVCPQPYTLSPCLRIVLLTSILISSYHTPVGLPRYFSSSLPTKLQQVLCRLIVIVGCIISTSHQIAPLHTVKLH